MLVTTQPAIYYKVLDTIATVVSVTPAFSGFFLVIFRLTNEIFMTVEKKNLMSNNRIFKIWPKIYSKVSTRIAYFVH